MPCEESTQAAEALKNDVAKAIADGDSAISGSIDAIKNVICRWKPTEVTEVGHMNVDTLVNGIGVLIAQINSAIQYKIMDMKKDLADKYYAMAKYKWERFVSNYMPLEKKLLREVSSVAIATMSCTDDRERAESAVNSAYSQLQQQLSRIKKSLHICIDENMLFVLEQKRVLMLVDTENFNLSDDQYWCDILNDDRWNKRSTVLDLGRNISTLSQSYGKLAKAASNAVSGQADLFTNHVLTSIGYYGARNDTYYPTTYIGTAAASTGDVTPSSYATGVGLSSYEQSVIDNALTDARAQVLADQIVGGSK